MKWSLGKQAYSWAGVMTPIFADVTVVGTTRPRACNHQAPESSVETTEHGRLSGGSPRGGRWVQGEGRAVVPVRPADRPRSDPVGDRSPGPMGHARRFLQPAIVRHRPVARPGLEAAHLRNPAVGRGGPRS